MENLYDVLEQQVEVPAAGGEESWKEEQKNNRSFCFETVEKELMDVAVNPVRFQQYLDTQSRFDQYSVRNTLLVMSQRPGATRLGDAGHWKEQGVFIKRTEWKKPVLILEPGNEYQREDGSIGQYFNPKKLYDVSQTTTRKRILPEKQVDERLQIQALISHAPVKIEPVEKQPKGVGVASLQPEENKIFILKGLDGKTMFQALAQELAKAQLLTKEHPAADIPFASYCASYLLCKRQEMCKEGSFDFSKLPKEYAVMEPQELSAELGKIRTVANELAGRMQPVLEQAKAEREKENHEAR